VNFGHNTLLLCLILLTKPPGERYASTAKPFQAALVNPVVYLNELIAEEAEEAGWFFAGPHATRQLFDMRSWKNGRS